MINQFKSRQFILFLLTGGVAAGVNFFSRIGYNHWFDFSTSVILAYMTGMVVAFILFRLFVFESSTSSLKDSIAYFCLVNAVGIAQTWCISMGLAHYLFPAIGMGFYPLIAAHGVGILVPAFTSYLGHKHFSFK